MTFLRSVLLVLLAWSAGTGAEDPLMPFLEHLDPDRLVTVEWGFDEAQGIICFRLSVNATGWVGLGFSPNGGMAGADIVIGGVGPNGTYFTDYHSIGNSFPLVDKEQSYTLLSLTEVDGRTAMTVQRPIRSCDEDDFHITAGPIKLIYAYGTSDETEYHETRRGTKELNLMKYMPRTSLPHTDYFNFTVDNVTIPPVLTHYHCRIMTLPRLNTKHQIIRIEASVENVHIIHHMLLYGCPPSVTAASQKECYTQGMNECYNVIGVWAIGGGPFEFPENAGIPIGAEDREVFYRLEIHYNNPTGAAGLLDNSGFKLYYTDKLRQHDVGILTTGIAVHDRSFGIPPGVDAFRTYGVCDTAQFSKHVDGPVPDLQVFSVELHTHLAGRKVRVGQFRNGTQIDFLGLNENYDFEMQDVTYLGNVKTVKPGDEIVVECTYSTANRTGVTQMGFATTDEMCLAFLLYYPVIGVNFCWSHPIIQRTGEDTAVPPQPRTQAAPPQPRTQAAPTDYEETLKDGPQLLMISDVHGNYSFAQCLVRDLMDTPSVSCRNAPALPNNSAARGLLTSWGLASTGSILLLLHWMTLF